MWRDIVVGVLVTLAFFGLLEAGARFFAPSETGAPHKRQIFFINDNDRDRDFVVERDPVLGYRLKQTGGADVFTDSNGRTFKRAKPADTYRIICLGGSTTYGTGSEFSGWSYPALLEKMFCVALAGCNRHVEVINAGMLGYHSWHSRIRVETELDALSPDLYLVMDGVNDIASLQGVRNLADLERERGLLTNLVAPLERRRGVRERLAGLLSHSALYRLARDWVRRLHGDKNYAALLEAFGYRDNMVTLIRGRKAKGIDTIIVNYPWSVRSGRDVGDNLRRLPPDWEISPDTVTLYLFGRKAITADNKRAVAATGAGLIDPQPLLDAVIDRDGYYSLYSDPVHFTKRGNLLLAREIYQGLLRYPPVRDFVSSCRLPDLYTIDSTPELHALATWGKGYRGRECRHGPAVAVIASRDNVAAAEGESGGLRPLAPADAARGPGIIRAKLTGPITGESWFYPRLCGTDDKVTVWAVGPGASRRVLFSLQKPYADGLWMPFCTRYALPGPLPSDVDHLEFELDGHAQVFADQEGGVLFQATPPRP